MSQPMNGPLMHVRKAKVGLELHGKSDKLQIRMKVGG